MKATNRLNGVIYLNAGTDLGKRVVGMDAVGEMVVNAPRPLPGSVTWKDDFHHGIFYAVGERTNEALIGLWKRDDAYEVVALTDSEIEGMFAAQYADMGYDYEERCQAYRDGGMNPHLHMARSFNLPHSSLWSGEHR